MFKTLRSRVISTYFLVVLISLILASVVFLFFLSRYHRQQEKKDLREQVSAVAEQITRVSAVLQNRTLRNEFPLDSERTRRLIQQTLDSESIVLKSKLFTTDLAGNVIEEARVRPMLKGTRVKPPESDGDETSYVNERFSSVFDRDYMIAAALTEINPGQSGFLMAVKPVEEIGGVASSLIWYMVLAGVIALAMSMLVALYLSSAISRPLREVTGAARKMAAGDYMQEVKVRGSEETAELAKDFNLMAKRVRTAHELQRNFVGNVSHELRTPLTSIEGFSQALLEGVSRSREEQRRSLEIINQESKRMVRVLRDLLLLSQIDAGEVRPEKKPVDLVDLLRKMESIYSGRAGKKRIALVVEPCREQLSVVTDPDRFEQILTNLMDNALKFTGPGGTVSVGVSANRDSVSVWVSDTGSGIPDDVLPHVFERFYRVEKSRSTRHGGSGLGLSICRELVKTLGGNISAESVFGSGTTFTVTLPL